MTFKYLFTGFPHSGSGYIAHLLSANGVPCGHEAFRAGGINLTNTPTGAPLVADSSHLGFTWFDHPVYAQAKIVLLVRHPVLVIRSVAEKSGRTTANFHTHRDIAARNWVLRNEVIEAEMRKRGQPNVVCPVEACPQRAFELVGLPRDTPSTFDNKKQNTHYQGKCAIGWEAFPNGVFWCDQLKAKAKQYGYSTTALDYVGLTKLDT